MNSKISDKVIIYLNKKIGLSYATIKLGIKLSKRNNTPLPLALWSYSLITTDELDKLYYFLWIYLYFYVIINLIKLHNHFYN